MLTLSLSTESEKSIESTLSIDRYSLLFSFVIECRNSLLFFEVSNIELFSTFSLSISNLGDSRNCSYVFYAIELAYKNLKNFHCDAIIGLPVVKLCWCGAQCCQLVYLYTRFHKFGIFFGPFGR